MTLKFVKSPLKYYIEYEVDWKGNTSNNYPLTYDITQEIVFEELVCEGYSFSWQPASIPVGSTGDITVKGTWTPNKYEITYKVQTGTEHSNPDTYTYGEELIISQATRGGYFVEWDTTSIPAGTIGPVTITASYTEKTLDQCYKNGAYEIWTRNQLESIINHPNGGSGRTYRLMDDIWSGAYATNKYWTPLSEFRGTLDGNGHSITSYDLNVTTSGSYGFCKINYGTIKNLTLGFRYYVSDDVSDVYIGSFAGTNKGTISNCSITAVYNRPYFRCYATGDSYMGCFVGVNEGTIDSCFGGDWLNGSCNMGTIAGKNSGTIKNCDAGNGIQEILIDYRDYNACVGGIVGLQTGGEVTNCNFHGRILFQSYKSNKYDGISDDREIQICAGIIIGYKQGGSVSGYTWELPNGVYGNIVSSIPTLSVVTWETGTFKKETHTHDQGLYFKNEVCGRID